MLAELNADKKNFSHYYMKATNTDIKLMRICFGGLELQVPEIWNVETETYTEPDGRECAMIDISATEGDARSIVISYGPMPDGSDAIMEAAGTYEELIGEIGASEDDNLRV